MSETTMQWRPDLGEPVGDVVADAVQRVRSQECEVCIQLIGSIEIVVRRTDPEPDREGLVEEDPLEALELTDAEKADLYYRRWQALREAAEAVCDFPMHDDDSPLAEAVRALRDRLREAGDGEG